MFRGLEVTEGGEVRFGWGGEDGEANGMGLLREEEGEAGGAKGVEGGLRRRSGRWGGGGRGGGHGCGVVVGS